MSDLFKLNLTDVLKAIIVAFISAFITAIYSSVSQGGVLDWPLVQNSLMVGLTAALAYLVKNFFTAPDKPTTPGA